MGNDASLPVPGMKAILMTSLFSVAVMVPVVGYYSVASRKKSWLEWREDRRCERRQERHKHKHKHNHKQFVAPLWILQIGEIVIKLIIAMKQAPIAILGPHSPCPFLLLMPIQRRHPSVIHRPPIVHPSSIHLLPSPAPSNIYTGHQTPCTLAHHVSPSPFTSSPTAQR